MGNLREFFEYIFNLVKIWIIVQPWEQVLRVRAGKNVKLLKGGIYFRIPYFDSLYVQSVRLRVVSMPMQTVTSKDKQAITVMGALGYTMVDIQKMYNGLYHPELTLSNMAMSALAGYIYSQNVNDLTAEQIEQNVLAELLKFDYGIKVQYFKLTNFAVVKTYRLIQDSSWSDFGINLNAKS